VGSGTNSLYERKNIKNGGSLPSGCKKRE